MNFFNQIISSNNSIYINTRAHVSDINIILKKVGLDKMVKKIFGSKNYESIRFDAALEKIRKAQVKLERIGALNSFTIEILAAITLSAISFYAFGNFSAGEFAAFFGALLMIISPIKSLSSINSKIQTTIAAAISVFDLMDEPQEIDQGNKVIKKAKGYIQLTDLTFKYQSSKHNILEDINLIINETISSL